MLNLKTLKLSWGYVQVRYDISVFYYIYNYSEQLLGLLINVDNNQIYWLALVEMSLLHKLTSWWAADQ